MKITQDIITAVESCTKDEDVRQEIYVDLLEGDLPEFETDTHRDNYLKQMAWWKGKNESTKESNRARLRQDNEQLIRDIYCQHAEYNEGPDKLMQYEQEVEEFLEILSDTYRRTFTKLFLDGLSPEELAEEEGVARNAIDQRVHNIKHLVKEKFNGK